MMILYALAALAALSAATYWYLTKTFNYWRDQRVPSAPDPLPGFGHLLSVVSLKESIVGFTERLYKQTDASAIGFYFLRTPGLVVRDPELAKCVMQTNFSSFRTNQLTLDEEQDPVLSKNPFFTTDPHVWKSLRNRTVAHLSGRKLRALHRFIASVAGRMGDFVERKSQGGAYECQLKEFFERYTGEFVANAAFGVEGESFEDQPSAKSFARVAKILLEPNFVNGVKLSLLFYLPSVARFFKLSFLQKSTDSYFRETLRHIISERKKRGIVADDYLQFCLEETSDDEFNNLIADIIVFYLDAYETSSLTLSILLYLLSKNTEVQEKLRQHVKSVVGKYDGEVTYESLKDMTYLDQVMFESMRMIPALGLMQKMCTDEIRIKGSDGATYHLKPGQPVFIPTAALQMDGRFWSDPEVFDPDRFSPERSNHHKFAFMPFGEGPRMCVGMRLGQMLVKHATASLILKFSFEHSALTKEPLERDSTTILSYHKGGLWAKFKKVS